MSFFQLGQIPDIDNTNTLSYSLAEATYQDYKNNAKFKAPAIRIRSKTSLGGNPSVRNRRKRQIICALLFFLLCLVLPDQIGILYFIIVRERFGAYWNYCSQRSEILATGSSFGPHTSNEKKFRQKLREQVKGAQLLIRWVQMSGN